MPWSEFEKPSKILSTPRMFSHAPPRIRGVPSDDIEMDDVAVLQHLMDRAEKECRASVKDAFKRLDVLKREVALLNGHALNLSREFHNLNDHVGRVALEASRLFAEMQDMNYLDNVIHTLQSQESCIALMLYKVPKRILERRKAPPRPQPIPQFTTV